MADHGNTNPGNFANRPTEEVKEIASKGGQASGSDASEAVQDKGKGKALAESADTSMMEDDESSSDEEPHGQEEAEDVDEDNMEEIDTDNIISGGRRTRGKNIDFAKAAEGLDDDEDDEEDDADFVDPDDEMKD